MGLSGVVQPSQKTFLIKRKLAKKAKQNRPIPQWIRFRTDNKIRCGSLPAMLLCYRESDRTPYCLACSSTGQAAMNKGRRGGGCPLLHRAGTTRRGGTGGGQSWVSEQPAWRRHWSCMQESLGVAGVTPGEDLPCQQHDVTCSSGWAKPKQWGDVGTLQPVQCTCPS